MKKRMKALLLVLCMLTAGFGAFAITSGAASFSVQPQIADGPGVQKFLLTNNGGAGNFTVSVDKQEVQKVYADAGATVSFNVDGDQKMTIIVQKDGTSEVTASTSLTAHYAAIYSKFGDNAPVQTGTATVYLDDGNVRVAVDEKVSYGGEMYECANPAQYIRYGMGSTTFHYTKIVQNPRQVTVYFIDENGYALGNDTFTIQPGSSATYTAKSSITVNNRKYNLAGGQNATITQSYNDTTPNYTLIYQGEAQTPQNPYTISISYVDSANGAVLKTETVTVPAGGRVEFPVAGSFVSSSYTEYERAANQPAVITHTSGESTRSYTVAFDRVSEQKPYSISVYCVDSVTGTLLASESLTVDVNGTAVYSFPSSLSHGGSQRTYYVYYNEVGTELPSQYQITVRYIDVTSNETLHTENVTVSDGQGVTIEAPADYEANGEEYVLLSGQTGSLSHSFYSPRRAYAIYYRNINDTANAESQVNEIVQVIEVEGEQVEQIVTTVTTPVVNEQGEATDETTTIIYNEDGEQVDEQGQLIPDEEVPLAPSVPETDEAEAEEDTTEAADEETQGETAQIEDETVPMASSVPGGHGPSAGMIAGISAAAVAVIAAIIAFVVVKKKRNAA